MTWSQSLTCKSQIPNSKKEHHTCAIDLHQQMDVQQLIIQESPCWQGMSMPGIPITPINPEMGEFACDLLPIEYTTYTTLPRLDWSPTPSAFIGPWWSLHVQHLRLLIPTPALHSRLSPYLWLEFPKISTVGTQWLVQTLLFFIIVFHREDGCGCARGSIFRDSFRLNSVALI